MTHMHAAHLRLLKGLMATALVGSIFSLPVSAQDQCGDVLTSGVHNTYQSISKSNVKSSYKDQLCDEQSSLNTSASGGGGSISVFGIGDASGQGGNSTVNDLKSRYCKINTGDLSDDDLQSLMKITIDPNIVENWRECMDSHGVGLFGNIDVNGPAVVFTIEWRGIAGLNSVRVKGSPQLDGVKCQTTPIASGAVLTNKVPLSESCQRVGNKAVTFVVNTTGGAKTLKLGAKQPPGNQPGVLRYRPSDPALKVDLKVIVFKSQLGNETHLRVVFTVPPVAGLVTSYNMIEVYGFEITQGGRIDLPPQTFPTINGRWARGDVATFELDVPNQFSDPSKGWEVRFGVGSSAALYPSPNLLMGNPF
jgi:hypothetical protein